jgi:DNA-binding transcriptional ArsR family regulator
MATVKTTTVRTAGKASRGKKSEAADLLRQAKRAAVLLKHVSDPTRLRVVAMLSEGERHVGGLCAELSQSQPAVSHHLALLRLGGIVASRRQGRNNLYHLTDAGEKLASIVKGVVG